MDALPEQYGAWISEALGASLARESKATCSDCAMCKPWPPVDQFKPDTKCCTFSPALPNFRVGAILADSDPAAARGREVAKARIRSGDGATPLELAPPRTYALAYPRLSRDGFGKDRGLLCPFFDQGNCSIWRWREAVCGTYFCKYDRGDKGRQVWNDARRLLLVVEGAVARWCALTAGVEDASLHSLVVLDQAAREGSAPQVTSPERVERAWGSWVGREEEFYLKCWELAKPLGWKDVLRLAGSEGDELARALWSRFHHGLSEEIPARLRLEAFTVHGAKERTVVITGYNGADMIDVDREALAALTRFDGRLVDVVLDEISRRDGVTIAREKLRELVDHGILRPV